MQYHPGDLDTTSVRDIPKWMVRGAAIVLTVVLLAFSVPVLWAAVSAGLGLLALAVMGAGGVVLFQAIPWGMQRLENRLLKLRKSEARANPIEQLENDVARRAVRLSVFRGALATVGGQIESVRQMLEDRQHKDPVHVLERQQRALQRLEGFYRANLHRMDQAHLMLEQFRSTVEQKKSEWEIAEAIRIASNVLDPHAADHLIQDLLSDEALRSVQNRFNTVFAELDIQMRSVDAPTRTLVAGSNLRGLDALSLPKLCPIGSRP